MVSAGSSSSLGSPSPHSAAQVPSSQFFGEGEAAPAAGRDPPFVWDMNAELCLMELLCAHRPIGPSFRLQMINWYVHMRRYFPSLRLANVTTKVSQWFNVDQMSAPMFVYPELEEREFVLDPEIVALDAPQEGSQMGSGSYSRRKRPLSTGTS